LLVRLVDFPIEGLDMSEFVCNPDLPHDYFLDEKVKMEVEKGVLLYDLIGISNHFGSTGGGHYTAYCK
jgi:ubiquitin carboxyl-terminal hydrolase 4/11